MGKKFLIVIALIVLAAAGFYTYKKTAKAPTEDSQTSNQQENNTQTPPAATSETTQPPATTTPPAAKPATNPNGGTFSTGEEEPTGPGIQVAEVNYTDQGFSPASVNIKVNDYVFFKNNSSSDVWPASNPHPTHTDYPGFDPKQRIAPGGEFKFQFTKAGQWGFHNHLNPGQGGTVNVTK